MSQLSFEGEVLYEDIKERGYALVEHAIKPEHIDELIAAYADFTDNYPDPDPETMNAMITDPKKLDVLDYSKDTQTEWHKYRTHIPHFAKPNGYTNRSYQTQVLRDLRGLEIEDDPKEYFHYTPSIFNPSHGDREVWPLRVVLQEHHKYYAWGPIPKEVITLNNHMQRVHHAGKLALTRLFGSLEETQPDITRFIRPLDLDISPVRLLFYHLGQGEQLAEGHHDRGFSTLQIAESHQGLRVRNPGTGEMDAITRDPSMGVAFPALKWKVAAPDSGLKSLWHDVMNIDTPNRDRHLHGRNVSRWALIFFTNSIELSESSIKARTHTEQNEEQVA